MVNGGGKPDTPGNGAILGDMKRWEKTQALLQVINHFIVAVCCDRAEVAMERMYHRNAISSNHTRPSFFSETETHLSVCVNFQ